MNQVMLDFASRAQAAILAAQAGDWGPANALELEYLNDPYNLVYPHGAEGEFEIAHAIEITRSDNGLIVKWLVVDTDHGADIKFEPCDHVLDAAVELNEWQCPMCDGRRVRAFYMTEADDDLNRKEEKILVPVSVVMTDIDGNILSFEEEDD